MERDTDKITLDDLRRPVGSELKAFRTFFRQELKTDVFLLDQMIRYLHRMKGKELRPILVLYAARLCGGINERTFRAATMIELLHTATLIHDDVVDDAEQRRGLLSINQVWKNKASILLGDFLLSKGLLVSLEADEFELLKIMSKAVKAMSEGELRQLKASKLQNMTEQKYFEIIRDKTASLLAACTESGAASASADPAEVQLMREIGLDLGIAFQIRDDLFDYGVDNVGKPLGNDIREKKITLPFIKALETCSFLERQKWKLRFRKEHKSTGEVAKITSFVHESGGFEAAASDMETYSRRALANLGKFPPTQARDDMEQLITYITSRKK
ncbi:octaprenyl-diphosphate synthase [Cyclonatronum proteinivorum]|uniref:Octaprenyl-diphosphate synthase n=2 Tax=Cyclonatronum proteinivorum TaxID=1457365 RepID=A0A345UM28_9BACT|nr:octaprenyl-diphosphate synthase [Cyclonatronum proteinivorum]